MIKRVVPIKRRSLFPTKRGVVMIPPMKIRTEAMLLVFFLPMLRTGLPKALFSAARLLTSPDGPEPDLSDCRACVDMIVDKKRSIPEWKKFNWMDVRRYEVFVKTMVGRCKPREQRESDHAEG